MKDHKIMSAYTAFLRGLYLVHQNCHWKSKGENFYGNHLLFQRLYEETQEDLDEAAEKTIGLYNSLDDMPDVVKAVSTKYSPEKYKDNCVLAAIEAEKTFLKLSEAIYNKLKESKITLGLDDFIMGVANKHEAHLYLLQQANK